MDRIKLLFLASLAETVCYEGEGGDVSSSDADGDNGDPGSGDASGDSGDLRTGTDVSAGKTFTQEDVNKMLAADKRKHQAQLQKVEAQLQTLSQDTQMSQQQREALEASLEDVRKQLRTKEQQAAIDKQNLEKSYQQRLADAESRAKEWETRYTTETIGRALTDAASKGDAFNTDQVVELLRNKTKLVDGKPMVDLEDTHAETGERIVTQLTPADAIKRMRELSTIYGNLFKSNIVSGIGGGGNADGMRGMGKVDVTKLTPEQYRKLRAENPSVLYGTR
ncbi:MAG: hypothetical protein ACTHK7_12180 [Aureliella sp.]